MICFLTHVRPGVQHCTQTEDGSDDFLLPHRPIERVIWILAGLWGQDNMGISAFAMLQTFCDGLLVPGFIVQQDRAGNVVELLVCPLLALCQQYP